MDCLEKLGSVASLPIFGEVLRTGLGGVLFMVCLCYWLASVVVEGGCKEPVRWVVGNRVTYPLDVVEELALASNVVVL